jgi:hypothetical protein
VREAETRLDWLLVAVNDPKPNSLPWTAAFELSYFPEFQGESRLAPIDSIDTTNEPIFNVAIF